MQISQVGIDLIKGFETLRLEAYPDTGDVWTIGWGHTKGVTPGMRISEGRAKELLLEDLGWAQEAVNSLVTVPLNQHQYDALVSFVFNIGKPAFADSTLLRLLNNGEYQAASDQFARWKYDDGKVIDGLVRRRDAESQLFRLDTPPKPLTSSRTMWAGALGILAAITSVVLPMLNTPPEAAQVGAVVETFAPGYGSVAVMVVSLAVTLYARWDDRRKGKR